MKFPLFATCVSLCVLAGCKSASSTAAKTDNSEQVGTAAVDLDSSEPVVSKVSYDPGAPATPVTLTTANFERQVLQSDRPVLVDFWAPWCGPCRRMEPTIEALAKEFRGQVTIAKLNIDEHGEIADRYQVTNIPRLIVFRGGRPVDSVVGVTSKEELATRLHAALGVTPVAGTTRQMR